MNRDLAPGPWTPIGSPRSGINVRKAGVAFFFKQWGGVQKKKAGRTLEGRTWDQMPAASELVML